MSSYDQGQMMTPQTPIDSRQLPNIRPPKPQVPIFDELNDRISQATARLDEISNHAGALHARLFGPMNPLSIGRLSSEGNKPLGTADAVRASLDALEQRINGLRYSIEQLASQL